MLFYLQTNIHRVLQSKCRVVRLVKNMVFVGFPMHLSENDACPALNPMKALSQLALCEGFVVLYEHRVASLWPQKHLDQIHMQDVLIDDDIALLLIGTGKIFHPCSVLKAQCQSQAIGVEVMLTMSALRTHVMVASQDTKVVTILWIDP